MKTIMTLVIGCTLALAGAVMAQAPETQESPNAKKGGKAEKTETTTQGAGAERGHKGKGANANANATGATTSEQGATGAATTEPGTGRGKGKGRGAKAETSAAAATGAETGTGANAQTGAGATTETGVGKGRGKGRGAKGKANADTNASAAATGTGAAAEAGASASVAPTGKHAGRGEKGMKGNRANANAAPSASMTPATAASATAAPTVAASASTAPSVAATGATGQQGTAVGANANAAATTGGNAPIAEKNVGRGGKRVETQKLQQIKQQHASFKAQPRPDRAPAVTFNQNYRIQNVERWQGPQYEVYRSYHPEWHDRGWYHSRYPRVELIAGGYYFFNNGYWYPAWGYDQGHAYYAYDAPIYVGHRAEPPDKVIADVQAELQDMGYYTGEVDGLLGPLTRQAVRDYQADHGLMVTEVIDEPTLDALQLS